MDSVYSAECGSAAADHPSIAAQGGEGMRQGKPHAMDGGYRNQQRSDSEIAHLLQLTQNAVGHTLISSGKMSAVVGAAMAVVAVGGYGCVDSRFIMVMKHRGGHHREIDRQQQPGDISEPGP